MTNLNLHPDLREEPFDAEAAAFDEFVHDLTKDRGAYQEEIIRQFLVDKSGPLSKVLDLSDWTYQLNGDHDVWLTDAEVCDVCGCIPEHLKARDKNNRPIKRHDTVPAKYQYSIIDCMAYEKSADIAADHGVERDVTAEKKLSAYIIRDSLNEWLSDDDNVRKLMEGET